MNRRDGWSACWSQALRQVIQSCARPGDLDLIRAVRASCARLFAHLKSDGRVVRSTDDVRAGETHDTLASPMAVSTRPSERPPPGAERPIDRRQAKLTGRPGPGSSARYDGRPLWFSHRSGTEQAVFRRASDVRGCGSPGVESIIERIESGEAGWKSLREYRRGATSHRIAASSSPRPGESRRSAAKLAREPTAGWRFGRAV